VATCALAGERITFDDLYSVPSIGDLQISPDGNHIAFSLRTSDLSTNQSQTHIWLIDSDGESLRQLTRSEESESSPRWSPDGTMLAFLSDRGDGSQIWVLPMDAGEPNELTCLSTGADNPVWSPDSRMIAFSSSVYPDCADDDCNREKIDSVETNPVEARLYDHLMFRHYNHWFDGRTDRIHTCDVESGEVKQVTFTFDDAPISPIGGHSDAVFSPDGSEICYVTNTDPVPALSTNDDLFVVPTTGDDSRRITTNEGEDFGPQYSPDGNSIAYLSMARAGYESDQTDLIIYNRETGERENLTDDFDLAVRNITWTPDCRHIYFMAIEHGFQSIWRINVETRTAERILGDAVYGDYALSPGGGYLAVTRTVTNAPYELYRYDIRSKKLTQLTHFNQDMTERLDMNAGTDFWFEGFNGDSVQGFLTLPPDFDSTKKYPLAFLIHGGPQWCWLQDFNYYGWNTQLMAAQGYVVAQVNPHGSVGYGQAFKEYVSGHWGEGDYEDLMLGVDCLLAQYPFIYSTRMAALGRSYGGFMINWICGHTNRFKCLICIDGTFNHIAEYGTTDELWFPEWEYKGSPWTNREEYIRSSPATYVTNFKTPTMVIHGQYDYRVDPSEAFQMFTSLQRMGVPSELLYYPDEGHSIHNLKNLRDVYQKQFEWLRKWLGE